MFAEVLGVEQVGLDDDFFGLGGNSLVATKLVSRLNAELPTRVPLQWLFREPGVEGLAALIDRESAGDVEESVAPVLPIRTRGAGTPLFFVHPIVGLSWCYTALARQLDHDAPVYGLQTPAVTEDDFEPATLDELAARYVDELRAAQPEGPYRLFGWSLGGVIAHAMAVRLQAEGERVDTLVMLDSVAGNGARTGESSDVSMSELLAGFGLDDADAAGAEDIDDLVTSVASLTGNTEDDTRRVMTRLVAAAQRNSELMAGHRPGTYDGDIVYFTAAADDPTGTRGASGWNAAVTGAVDNHQVPATHWQMTSPDALDVIVPVLERCSPSGRAEVLSVDAAGRRRNRLVERGEHELRGEPVGEHLQVRGLRGGAHVLQHDIGDVRILAQAARVRLHHVVVGGEDVRVLHRLDEAAGRGEILEELRAGKHVGAGGAGRVFEVAHHTVAGDDGRSVPQGSERHESINLAGAAVTDPLRRDQRALRMADDVDLLARSARAPRRRMRRADVCSARAAHPTQSADGPRTGERAEGRSEDAVAGVGEQRRERLPRDLPVTAGVVDQHNRIGLVGGRATVRVVRAGSRTTRILELQSHRVGKFVRHGQRGRRGGRVPEPRRPAARTVSRSDRPNTGHPSNSDDYR